MFILFFVFFFKQKTAYEMRISDWSSDLCSSDLHSGADRAPDWRCRMNDASHNEGAGAASTATGPEDAKAANPASLSNPDQPMTPDEMQAEAASVDGAGLLNRIHAFTRRDRKSTRLNSSH